MGKLEREIMNTYKEEVPLITMEQITCHDIQEADIRIEKLLVTGNRSNIYSGWYKQNGEWIEAVFKIFNAEHEDLFQNEASLLLRFNHNNIIGCFGVVTRKAKLPGADGTISADLQYLYSNCDPRLRTSV